MVLRALFITALLLASLRPAFAETPAAPTEAERLVRAVDLLSSDAVRKCQKGLRILGQLELPGSEKALLEQFDKLAAGELSLALWLDLYEAAEHRGTPALLARLKETRAEYSAAKDPLRAFRECLEGGDAGDGREVFFKAPEAGCIRCHSVNGEGGQIGPELAGLGLRTDRIYILESILMPDAAIVQGYGHQLLRLKGGEVFSALVNSETRDEMTVISIVDGTRRRIKTSTIESREGLPTIMPPIFGQALTRRQLRDLVEFIATVEPG